MAKEAPAITLSIDCSSGTARNISNCYTNGSISTPRNPLMVTGADKTAEERLLGLADYSGDYNGIFNDASNVSHDVFKTIPSSSITRTVSFAASGQTLAVEAILLDYGLTRGQDSSLIWAVNGQLQSGSVPTWS
jgi:hypothetical protein